MQKLIIMQMKKGIVSAALGLLFFAISTLAVSYLTYHETITVEKTKSVMIITLFLSCVISGILSSKGMKTGKWRTAACSGGIILLFIM